MKAIRTYHEVAGPDRSDLLGQVVAQREKVAARLAAVRHPVAVMSGKGGVGKSFVTAGLAAALAGLGRRVGVLDADLHGPTAARMLGASAGGPLALEDGAVRPVTTAGGVRVMSSDLLLAEGAPLRWREPAAEGHVWRGALEAGMLREFLGDVAWGELDVLLVDLPPGTERFEVLAGLVPSLAGVVVVSIPTDASLRAVRRSLGTARALGVRVLGVVENMAAYACGSCGSTMPLFRGDAGAQLAQEADAPVLARIPFDVAAQEADAGGLPSAGPASVAIHQAAAALMARVAPA